MAEHTVLSYVPYLQEPPTQTQTGSERPSDTKSPMPITDECSRKAAPITTDQATDPFGPRTWHSNLIKLSGKNRALNEFSVERVGECVDQNLVMLHGYGAGLGFFYKNFEGLSRARGWKLYALDLLGMGRSSRPPFKVHTKDRQGSITEAENWFIDALEEWRVQKKIERFTLLGHSLGGYLAVAYALKYPGHLNKLILASPVGIPEDVYAVNADMPDPQTSTLEQEVGQGQNAAVNNSITDGSEPRKFGDNNNFLNARSKEQTNGKHADSIQPSPPRKPLPKWLTYLWDANISPFSLVRLAGPLGPRFSSGWTSRRFSHLPPDEKQALHDYAYSLFRQRGSGEYALAYILAPGAYARSPLIRRIHGVGRQMISPDGSTTSSVAAADKRRENGIPVVMIYGENDWMDIAGGYAAAKKIEEEKRRTLKELPTEERRKDNGSAKVMIINKAGHHMYLEGWEEFNDMMSKEMDEVSLKKSGKSLDSSVSV
jgi:cardiolipin-specific phospholipase